MHIAGEKLVKFSASAFLCNLMFILKNILKYVVVSLINKTINIIC